MPFAESQDLLRIYYDDRGEAEPVLLCLRIGVAIKRCSCPWLNT